MAMRRMKQLSNLLESGIGFHMNNEDQSAISIARDTHSIAIFSLFERHLVTNYFK